MTVIKAIKVLPSLAQYHPKSNVFHQSCMSGEIIFPKEGELTNEKTEFCAELMLIVQMKSLTSDICVMTKVLSFYRFFGSI